MKIWGKNCFTSYKMFNKLFHIQNLKLMITLKKKDRILVLKKQNFSVKFKNTKE